jgi:hypothetical protein
MKFNQVTNAGEKKITRGYGMKMHPIHKRMKMHHGIDIPVSTGHDIYSIADGIIIDSEIRSDACGGTIKVSHGVVNGKKLYTRFCHCSKLLKKKGDIVKQGDVIAKSGGGKGDPGRGGSTGPHIHFEVYENGSTVDPMPYYKNSVGGEQTELPSEVDLDKYKDELEKDGDLDMDTGDTKKTSRQVAKDLIKKLFGIDKNSSIENEVVNEIFRVREIIEELIPTFKIDTGSNNDNNDGKTCGPYDPNSLPVKPCTSRVANGNVITYTGSDVIAQDTGTITGVTKGSYTQAIKIGNTAYYWNGSLDKQMGVNINKGDKLGMTGSDKKLITQPYSSQTPNKTQTSTPSKNDGKTVNPLAQTSSDSRNQAKNYVKNIINTLTGTQTQAPTTKKESIEKLKPLIENELKSFKKFIK